MKRNTFFALYIILYVLSIALCVIPTGCSKSEADSGEPDSPDVPSGVEVPVTITLSACPNNGTRADEGKPKDPEASEELIHDWWIAFVVPKTGDVKVVTREQAEDRTTSTSVDIEGGGFEAETFRTTLPAGTYRIYAFANIEPVTAEFFKKNYLKKDGDEWKHKDLHLSDFSDIADKFINTDNGKMQWPKSENINIPMSGVMSGESVVIKNTVEHIFNIEVVRAVAKVEFDFSNPSADNITLENLTLEPISNDISDISIIPNYKAIGIKANDKLITDGVSTGTLSLDLGSKQLTTANPNHTVSFYCNESLPHDQKKYNANPAQYKDNESLLKELYPQPFNIDLTVKINGEEKTYSYQTKKITYINRNDWIHIPITFTAITPDFEINSYPPIGGYAAVLEESEDHFSAPFSYGGDFEIRAFMRQGELEMNPDNFTVEITEVSDPDNILSSQTFNPSQTMGKYGFANFIKFDAHGTAVINFKIVYGSTTYTREISLIKN